MFVRGRTKEAGEQLVREIDQAIRVMRVKYVEQRGMTNRLPTFSYTYQSFNSYRIEFVRDWSEVKTDISATVKNAHPSILKFAHSVLKNRGWTGLILGPGDASLHFYTDEPI